jgi:hypothetical protein
MLNRDQHWHEKSLGNDVLSLLLFPLHAEEISSTDA